MDSDVESPHVGVGAPSYVALNTTIECLYSIQIELGFKIL